MMGRSTSTTELPGDPCDDRIVPMLLCKGADHRKDVRRHRDEGWQALPMRKRAEESIVDVSKVGGHSGYTMLYPALFWIVLEYYFKCIGGELLTCRYPVILWVHMILG